MTADNKLSIPFGLQPYAQGTAGAVAGGAAAVAYTSFGIETAVHEVAGHGLLGGELLHNYKPGLGPAFQIDAVDNFKAIFHSSSIKELIDNLILFATNHDRDGDGMIGKAWVRHGTPNEIGQALGDDGRSAWVSLSGSVPGLVINSTSAVVGVYTLDRYPVIGALLITFALVQHYFSSRYPLDAAWRTTAELQVLAKMGHDFAGFAVKISNITGFAPSTVAKVTALLWTASVPAITVGAFFKRKSDRLNRVSDGAALRHLLAKEEWRTKVRQMWDAYPGKQLPYADWDFEKTALAQVPKRELNQAKEEILAKWEKEAPANKLALLTLAGPVLSIATRLSSLLSSTIPLFRLITPLLGIASLGAMAISIIGATAEAASDVRNETLDKKVKFISVVKALAITCGVVGSLIAKSPVIKGIALLTLLAAPLVGDFAKERMIRQSREPQLPPLRAAIAAS